MHRNPPAAPDPDRTDLSLPALNTRLYPDTRLPRGPLPPDPITRQDPNGHLLQVTQIPPDIRIEALQIQDRIPYQLPRSVKGDIPSPVGPKKLYPPLFHLLLID